MTHSQIKPGSNQQQPELLKDTEVARLSGMSESFYRRCRREGRGPLWLKLGKAVRYPRADFFAWLESRKAGGGEGAR